MIVMFKLSSYCYKLSAMIEVFIILKEIGSLGVIYLIFFQILISRITSLVWWVTGILV